MKKFFDTVLVDVSQNGCRLLLDGKPVKTPLKDDLVIFSQDIADKIAQEWRDQEDVIDVNNMPLTQIAITAQDYIGQNRKAIEEALVKYLESDLICYPAEAPKALYEKQKEVWLPWLDWFSEKLGIVLPEQEAIIVHTPSGDDVKKMQEYMGQMDDWLFTLFQLVAAASGSLVLACAFMAKKISAQELLELCKLEEIFYVAHYDLEKHGPDPQQQKQQEALLRDFKACEIYLKYLA